jgi:hypothetical protein
MPAEVTKKLFTMPCLQRRGRARDGQHPESRRDPAHRSYKTRLTLHRSDSVSFIAIPDVVFKVETFLT